MEVLSKLGVVGDVIHFVIILLEVLLVFNLLILVHELGHFLAARLCGLKVEKFYIWFGKPLWKKTFNGVEYGLGSVPMGGFVALPQMAPMGGLEGTNGDEPLPPVSPMAKIIVAFAGPLFSFLLAVVFAFLVWQVGMPDQRIHTTTIGWVQTGSPGEKAGFKPGDKILAVDGTPVNSWNEPVNSVTERIAFSTESKIVFTVQRPGVDKPLDIPTSFDIAKGGWFVRKGLRKVGLGWAFDAPVSDVLKGSGAEKAGIMKGDKIATFNGATLYSPLAVYEFFTAHPDSPAKLGLLRDGKPLEVTLTPIKPVQPEHVSKAAEGLAFSGIVFDDQADAQEEATVYLPPGQQLTTAATMMFHTFGAVFGTKGDVGIQQMGGPVKIFSTYYFLFTSPSGWKKVLWFSVILNVNLALMNLVPFPIFDGGHIVMALGEMIRRKSLLPLRILEFVQGTCVVLLLVFFTYVTWFDTADLFGAGTKKDKEVPTKPEDIKYSVAG